MAEIILPPEENEETPQVPELNIDKPTENSKVITIEFEAKKTNKVSTKDTNQQLYTTDTDAWFEFKETSLESANGTYSVVFRNRHDGSIFQRTGDVVNGVAYYKIPHQEIRHAGAWRGQIVYTLSNGDTTAREFDYDVKGHILDGKDVREIVVEDFETLMSQLRSMKDNAEVELTSLKQELENIADTAEQNETDRQAFFDDLVEDIDGLQANYQELLDTGVLQTNINTKLEQLEEEYAPKLTEVTAQLAQTDDKLENKVGNGVLAEMGDLSQEVKESMTGGSVAVVGDGAVTIANLANDVKKEVESISNKEGYVKSYKNIFNPERVISGRAYSNSGALTHNSNYNLYDKFAVDGGSTIAISGLTETTRTAHLSRISFWTGENGEQHKRHQVFINFPNSDDMVLTLDDDVTYISLNLNMQVPEQLQIELNDRVTDYEPYRKLENAASRVEVKDLVLNKTKNLYDHSKKVPLYSVLDEGIVSRPNQPLSFVSSIIPLEQGKTYTLSGYNLRYMNPVSRHLILFNDELSAVASSTPSHERNIQLGENSTTFTVGENERYLVFPVSQESYQPEMTIADVDNLKIQLEKSEVATSWVPYRTVDYIEEQIKYSTNKIINDVITPPRNSTFYTEFVDLDKVRSNDITLEKTNKDLSPFGIYYSINSMEDSGGNILYSQINDVLPGEKSVFARMATYREDEISTGSLKKTDFKVPSGMIDNEGGVNSVNDYEYCHPSIAYSSDGVAGYKYWMISSILPGLSNDQNSTWEDEDLFVSNDGENWMRVRSLYEPDKDYHAPNVSLPPHSLVTTSARRHGFLPQPMTGSQLEVSSPADNGGEEVIKETVTVGNGFKHDPAIFIDGGYVYTYHSFHVPYGNRTRGQNRYIVCVRTSNGKDWEVVRTDGSTMLLTEETSREIFTMDNQGRYNFMYYAFSRSYGNPEIIKYGENDYEMVYGYNFTLRVKGTTPYNFDFNTHYPFEGISSGNHPGLLYDGENLMLINNERFLVSTNRGETFEVKPHYPAWKGGVSSIPYKKAMCIGEAGRVLLVEAQRTDAQSNTSGGVGNYHQTKFYHQLYTYEFESVEELINYSENGLEEGYIDVQYSLLNYENGKREGGLIPYITNTSQTPGVNTPMEKVKVMDLEFEAGDILYIFITLNSRNNTEIRFSGFEIS